MTTQKNIKQDAIDLLKTMIETPSFSKEEKKVADRLESFLNDRQIATYRFLNNVYALNKQFNPTLPTILLNSHHDTVKPNAGYTADPFVARELEGKIIGLGSNDAGGSLVSLIAAFIYFYDQSSFPFNLVLAATAEEEISGSNGVEALLADSEFKKALQGSAIVGALVGEPTQMKMAVAEKGLMVVDAVAAGKAGHAARNEGINSIDIAIRDIEMLHTLAFEKKSDLTGETRATVTVIETENKAHNVVPSECKFVIDLRINECYTFEEVLDLLEKTLKSKLTPRSMRLRSTLITMNHPLVQAGKRLGIDHYGSPTTSDKALMHFPALKIGPGDSARSHTADEYIYVNEIESGIDGYIRLLEQTAIELKNKMDA